MNTRPLILSIVFAACIVLILLLSVFSPTISAQQNVAPDPSESGHQPDAPITNADRAPQTIIRGRLLNGRAGLRVQAVLPGARVAAETYTGPDGQFSFSELPGRHYRLLVFDEQGRPLELEIDADMWPEQAGMPIELTLALAAPPAERGDRSNDKPATELEKDRPSVVQANGFITGVVTAADTGLPYDSVLVQIYNNAGSLVASDWPDFFTAVYSITVPPGTYRVYFNSLFTVYAPEWYNNQRDFASATPVIASDSAVTANINAILEVGGQIAGRVTASIGGAALNNVTVYAYDTPTSTGFVSYDATNSSGIYTITGLLTGTYYLKFSPLSNSDYLEEYYNNKPNLASADGVPVTLGGVTSGIDASLETGGKITGTVTSAANGSPVANVNIYAYTSTTSTSYDAFGFTDATGRYTLRQLTPANYYLKFAPLYGSDYLEEYYSNKRSLTEADAIPLTYGAVITGINAALETGGKITGQVTGIGGTPLQDVFIQVYTSTTSLYAVSYVDTNASGIYTITSLDTGNYYLKFSPSYGTEYLEEYYVNKRSLVNADPISVTLGNVTNEINATLEVGGKITGLVTEAAGGTPLENVYVYAYTSTTSTNYAEYAYTNQSGVYTMTGLWEGAYYLEFDPLFSPDYLPEFYNNQRTLVAADPIPVTFGSVIGNINAALDVGGKISGRVTNANTGLPIQGVSVYAYTNTTASSAVAYDDTDAAGVYTITQLVSGQYYLRFNPPFGSDYLLEYYNDKPDLSVADPVNVALNSVTSNINATLASGGKMTGRITGSDTGLPLADVHVIVYDCNNFFINSTTTGADGMYTITALATGSYRVQFEPLDYGTSKDYIGEYYNNKASLSTADLVNVTAPNSTGSINAALDRGGGIKGQVTAADTSLPLSGVFVYALNNSESSVASATTDATGNYTITALASGSYRVHFKPSGSSAEYVAEYYNNKASFGAADPVNVSAPGVTSGVNAVLDRGGKITGVISAADGGAPLQSMYVRVYTSTTSSSYGYIASASTNASGVYTITGLRAGSYYLKFDPSFSPAEDYIIEYYNNKSSLASADAVNVTAPTTTGGIDAVLDRGGKITGRVTTASTGTPIQSAYVRAYVSPTNYVAYDFTDSGGNYVLPGLPTGNYRVRFYASVAHYVGCSVTYDSADEYYNDKPNYSTADAIAVAAPNVVTGIDAALQLSGIQPPLDHKIYLPLVRR